VKKFSKISLVSLLILLLVACGVSATPEPSLIEPTTAAAETADPFRVAVVVPSAVNDFAFSQSMYDALLRIQENMGGPDYMEFVYSQGMFVVDDAAAALRTYAEKGYDLVIAHGSQYGASLAEIAPDFPQTSFAHGTTVDTFGLSNVFAYTAASEEGGFVNGVLAASITRSNIIGVIGPIEVGDAKLYVDGFKAGVAATDPDIEVKVTYIGSFADVVKGSEAAVEFIEEGADVLTGTAQMVVGPISKASENNVVWFGTQSNQTSLAPAIVVANQAYHWEVILEEIIDNVQSGVLGGDAYTINLANGGEVIEINPEYKISQRIQSLADKTISEIIDGGITINFP
jgi:basic membrane lipoprotein Med (substrate-binding protein (PBP1-ABC) superfamily)